MKEYNVQPFHIYVVHLHIEKQIIWHSIVMVWGMQLCSISVFYMKYTRGNFISSGKNTSVYSRQVAIYPRKDLFDIAWPFGPLWSFYYHITVCYLEALHHCCPCFYNIISLRSLVLSGFYHWVWKRERVDPLCFWGYIFGCFKYTIDTGIVFRVHSNTACNRETHAWYSNSFLGPWVITMSVFTGSTCPLSFML